MRVRCGGEHGAVSDEVELVDVVPDAVVGCVCGREKGEEEGHFCFGGRT